MATVQKFEELKIWQLARQIARQVYAMTQGGAFAKDFGLKDQIQQTAQDVGYVSEGCFAELYELLTSESRMISRFQSSLRQSQVKGRYYKDEELET